MSDEVAALEALSEALHEQVSAKSSEANGDAPDAAEAAAAAAVAAVSAESGVAEDGTIGLDDAVRAVKQREASSKQINAQAQDFVKRLETLSEVLSSVLTLCLRTQVKSNEKNL